VTSQVGAQTAEPAADVRAREVEAQMTDEERFSLLISVIGAIDLTGVARDER
jgi:beta-glucosidase